MNSVIIDCIYTTIRRDSIEDILNTAIFQFYRNSTSSSYIQIDSIYILWQFSISNIFNFVCLRLNHLRHSNDLIFYTCRTIFIQFQISIYYFVRCIINSQSEFTISTTQISDTKFIPLAFIFVKFNNIIPYKFLSKFTTFRNWNSIRSDKQLTISYHIYVKSFF